MLLHILIYFVYAIMWLDFDFDFITRTILGEEYKTFISSYGAYG